MAALTEEEMAEVAAELAEETGADPDEVLAAVRRRVLAEEGDAADAEAGDDGEQAGDEAPAAEKPAAARDQSGKYAPAGPGPKPSLEPPPGLNARERAEHHRKQARAQEAWSRECQRLARQRSRRMAPRF